MKYLFIFLPFFAFGQDTIVRGSDTMIIGRSYYDDHSFYKEWTRAGKSKDAPGGDSTLYGVRFDSVLAHKITSSRSSAGFYYGGDLKLEGGVLYRYVTPKDTLKPVKPRMMEYAPNGGGDGRWKYCDKHLNEGEIGAWRDSSSVNVLIWDGCKLIQKRVDKFENYTYSGDAYFSRGTLEYVKQNYSVTYVYKGKIVKYSYIIKEL